MLELHKLIFEKDDATNLPHNLFAVITNLFVATTNHYTYAWRCLKLAMQELQTHLENHDATTSTHDLLAVTTNNYTFLY